MIRSLAAEEVPKALIAKRLGISRTTVVKAGSSPAPPRYERKPLETSFIPFESRVRAMLAEFPDRPAAVLAERAGWTGSGSWFGHNVARLRPEYRRVDPADRLVWLAGDVIQCDLSFPPQKTPCRMAACRLMPVLTTRSAFLRFILARILPSRKAPDLLLGMSELVVWRGPQRLM